MNAKNEPLNAREWLGTVAYDSILVDLKRSGISYTDAVKVIEKFWWKRMNSGSSNARRCISLEHTEIEAIRQILVGRAISQSMPADELVEALKREIQ